MPEASTVVQVAFKVGLDEGTDPSQIAPGTLTYVRNGVWNKLGRIETRQGSNALATTQLDGGALAGTIARVLARDAEKLATDGAYLFSYVQQAPAWKRVQPIQALEATWTTLADTTRSITAGDVAATSAYRVTAWASPVGLAFTLFGQVEDVATGAKLLPPIQIGTVVGPFRVVLLGTKAIFIWQDNGGATIRAQNFDLTTLTFGPLLAPAADAMNATMVPWDVSVNGANWTLAYQKSNGDILLKTFDSSISQVGGTVTVAAAVANVVCVGLHATAGENLYVIYAISGTHLVKLAAHNPATLAQTTAPATVYTGTGDASHIAVVRFDASNCIIALTELIITSTVTQQTITLKVSSSAVVNSPSHRITRWSKLASKPFTLGGRFYVFLSSVRPPIVIVNGRITQNTTFAVEIATTTSSPYTGNLPHKLSAVVAPREGAIPDAEFTPCSVPVVGSDAWTAALYVAEAVSANNIGRNALRLVKASTTLSDPWAPASIAHDLVTVGGLNAVYDGRRQFPLSFLHAPRVISATPSAAGGNMAAGTYLYSFVYEWYDATGLLHRSIPSQPISVTTTGTTGSVAFVLESAITTGRADEVTGDTQANALPVNIIAYRTVVGGSTFFRLRTETAPGFPGTGLIENAAFAASVSWTDTSLDTSIDGSGTQLTTRPLLYTTGGFLDEVMPPSGTTQTLHRDRLWVLSGDRRTLWATKKFTEDPTVFPGFHEDLTVTLDVDIVALRSLDDKLAILTETTPYILYGDGPNAAGQGSDWDLARLQGDVGCRSARSVVSMPGGLMFLSARGYYSLTRELELQWIGRQVKDELAAYPFVEFAELLPHRSQARIGVATAAEDDGVVLVYDYSNGNWSVFNYPNAVVRSSVVIADVWHFAGAGAVFFEDNTTWLDAGAFISLDFEFVLTPSGPVAWQHLRRFQLLGQMQTNHDLRLRLAFNGSASYAQDFTFTAQTVQQNNDCPTVRIGSQNGANPKAKMLRARVTVVTPTNPGTYPVGSGRGGWFSGVGLELIPKPGLPRHGARFSKQ
jgi:hypothetical protein